MLLRYGCKIKLFIRSTRTQHPLQCEFSAIYWTWLIMISNLYWGHSIYNCLNIWKLKTAIPLISLYKFMFGKKCICNINSNPFQFPANLFIDLNHFLVSISPIHNQKINTLRKTVLVWLVTCCLLVPSLLVWLIT